MLDHTLHLDMDDDRHLVVGDIHGFYDVFMRLLDKANYDPAKDVVYSVGDMIDRGPDSVKVVEFFNQERCYAVQGNHELMMAHPRDWSEAWYHNGGIATMEDIERGSGIDFKAGISANEIAALMLPKVNAFIQRFKHMPWVIDVGEKDDPQAFRILHAEMPAGWDEPFFQSVLNQAISVSDPLFSHIVWSRKLIAAGVKNVENMKPAGLGIPFHEDRYRTVFAGHTPVKEAMKVGDHWFIDTFRSQTMTMIDAQTYEKFVVAYDGSY